MAKMGGGAPGEIRTPDPLVRSQMLYPAELRARFLGRIQFTFLVSWFATAIAVPRFD